MLMQKMNYKGIRMLVLSPQVDKLKITGYPRILFTGKIETISTIPEMEKAVRYLGEEKVLGIDTETKPNFSKTVYKHKVALLQISTNDICFLFRLNYIGLPQPLTDLLCSDRQLKVGLSLQNDILMLNERSHFKMGKWVDLQRMARDIGIVDQSLQKIYANVFHRYISKSQRLTNWERDVLTDAQKRYAATDAWACLNLYNKLYKLKTTHDYILKTPLSPHKLIDSFVKDFLNTQR